MLTGADLDTKRSLDGALVQISLPSQTQTSRQIAWVNVIGVTSAREKKKKTRERKPTRSPHQTSGRSRFSHYYHVKGGKKKKSGELKKSAELASLN